MWLQHRGKWSVSSEATGERVELEFGCFGGAASGEFAAALRDEADEAARLLLRESGSGDALAPPSCSPASSPTPASSSSSSCAESFETVGFAPGAALSDRERAVAAKRRALREVRGRLVHGGCGGCGSCRKGGGGGSSCPGSRATGITLAGAWDSGLVIIDDSVSDAAAVEEEGEGEAPPPSTSPSAAAAASAAASAPQRRQQRRKRRSIIWTAAIDATSPVARGDNRYCMSRWTLALNEEDGAAEAAAAGAGAAAAATPRFGAFDSSSTPHSSLFLPLACHSRSSVAFRAPPATDSRRRPDLRAVEHGNWEAASAARDALLAAQARRAAASSSAAGSGGEGRHEPAWFRVRDSGATAGEAFMFEYAGGYWADRKRRAAEDDRERRRAAAAASGENDDDDDHLFFDAQEAPF